MSDVKVKKLCEVAPYSGANSIPGIRFRPLAREMGVSAWGMNVLEIDAGCSAYPEHDHTKDGQEEVYLVLEGSAKLETGGEKLALEKGSVVRVGPGTKRKFLPGEKGVTLLAIGATPGKAYEPR